MNHKEELVLKLINSLENEFQKWNFGRYVAENDDWGISLWIANIPMLDLGVYKPTKVRFSLNQKYRLYKALDYCRSKKIISMDDK